MDPKKQCLVFNMVNFLQEEVTGGSLNDERKESVEVAIQCLETAFEIDSDARTKLEPEKVDLLSLINMQPTVEEITEEQKNEAESFKNKGNTHMRNTEYAEAVAEYTKAIQLNPHNAVYYCNRAAAYSRLEKHAEVITDCQAAIKLDPTYGKAYGRLGIAYSNLNQYEDARKAYLEALKYDPTNATYETNLKLAEEQLLATMESAAPPEHRPLDISQFINHPNIINMASQMLTDPSFRNILMQLMSMGESGDPRFNNLFQIGQNLAQNLETSDPSMAERLRESFNTQNVPTAPPEEGNEEPTSSQSKDTDKQSE